ncbi:hypothetical protein B0T17DRAFT_523162 [Bombardia bombarda]|uniref:Uncharacterized protein n=1 Tax=Bombardia bombarda TaxID=252184 RepID=A0AA39X775_9PEZI|nr:hypothetical protein B0T17DRAFT_523162 [Bombardia bombarda]
MAEVLRRPRCLALVMCNGLVVSRVGWVCFADMFCGYAFFVCRQRFVALVSDATRSYLEGNACPKTSRQITRSGGADRLEDPDTGRLSVS